MGEQNIGWVRNFSGFLPNPKVIKLKKQNLKITYEMLPRKGI